MGWSVGAAEPTQWSVLGTQTWGSLEWSLGQQTQRSVLEPGTERAIRVIGGSGSASVVSSGELTESPPSFGDPLGVLRTPPSFGDPPRTLGTPLTTRAPAPPLVKVGMCRDHPELALTAGSPRTPPNFGDAPRISGTPPGFQGPPRGFGDPPGWGPTSGVVGEHAVEDAVGRELAHAAGQALPVQRLQLCLALVELLVVTLGGAQRPSGTPPQNLGGSPKPPRTPQGDPGPTFSRAMRAWVS